jgi:alkanesulfonate monooxygenase SsuD/methylene tetrahydromethanopterin reductase-like flavin-dependent oxidoreductase (luciferase family)
VPYGSVNKKISIWPLAVSPFEMHPLKIVNALLTLNEMSNGRTQIAICAGEVECYCNGLNTTAKK